jgi:hypothetical protein
MATSLGTSISQESQCAIPGTWAAWPGTWDLFWRWTGSPSASVAGWPDPIFGDLRVGTCLLVQ